MKTSVLTSKHKLPVMAKAELFLLACGIIANAWYFIINIIVPPMYEGYKLISQTVSELSAIDAPTRIIWIQLCFYYTILFIAFGAGTWLCAGNNKKIQWIAVIIIVDAVIGLFWPPMHKREVLAAGGGTLTDTLHIIWTGVHLILVLSMIVLGAAVMGKAFRIYSSLTLIIFLVFGILTSVESPGIAANKPTPYIGLWERVNMGAYMVWLIVFSILLMQKRTREYQDGN